MPMDLSIMLCTHVCNAMVCSEAPDVLTLVVPPLLKGPCRLVFGALHLLYKRDFSPPTSGCSLASGCCQYA